MKLNTVFIFLSGAARASQRISQFWDYGDADSAQAASEHWAQHDRHPPRTAPNTGRVRIKHLYTSNQQTRGYNGFFDNNKHVVLKINLRLRFK